jgi:hypothetical protein
VAGHTNHVIDQLLRHIAIFEPDFMRLGGQTTDKEKICPNASSATRTGRCQALIKTSKSNGKTWRSYTWINTNDLRNPADEEGVLLFYHMA